MNFVFQKCGSKYTASKFHLLWKRSYDEYKLMKYVNRRYWHDSRSSLVRSFGPLSCQKCVLEVTFVAIKSLGQQTNRLLTVSKNRCWKCNAVVTERDLVCMACGCVQEPKQNLNLFEIFKETPNFDIDVRNLVVKFRRLQTLLHPDKFASRSEKEQEYSLAQSIRVNKAYQTLLRPMDRGLYLLELNGKPLLEGEVELPSDFLSDIMEVNEMLSECKTADILESIRHVNDAKLEFLFSALTLAFKEKNFTRARDLLSKLKYYTNIDERIKNIEDEFGISRDD